MLNRLTGFILTGFITVSICGCLYRGDGVFKKLGNSDYKARVNILSMLIATDGNPTNITGTVVLNDMFTPIKFTTVILRKKDQQAIVTQSNTDSTGRFTMSGILVNDTYTIEIDSLEYTAFKTILVEPERVNDHELFAHRK